MENEFTNSVLELPSDHFKQMTSVEKEEAAAAKIGLDIEEFWARWTIGECRPKQPEKIQDIYPLELLKEELIVVCNGILRPIFIALREYKTQIRAFNDELYRDMFLLQQKSMTLLGAARSLENDAQLFDIWQNVDFFQTLDNLRAMFGIKYEHAYEDSEEVLNWQCSFEHPWEIYICQASEVDILHYDLAENIEDRIRAILSLRPEQTITELEKSREEIEILKRQKQKAAHDAERNRKRAKGR